MENAAPPAAAIDFGHLGEPELWTCPKCGEAILVYETCPLNHFCGLVGVPRKIRTFYFYYTMLEDHRIKSLHLVGADESDPLLRVEGFDHEGRLQRWKKRSENGETVFYPFSTDHAREHVLGYSQHIQKHEAIPRRELERRATRGRHSA
jgi:hypothetical protein